MRGKRSEGTRRGQGKEPGKDVVSREPWSMNCTTGLVPPGGEGVGLCVPTSSSATGSLPHSPSPQRAHSLLDTVARSNFLEKGTAVNF